jgi:hypothetical protein
MDARLPRHDRLFFNFGKNIRILEEEVLLRKAVSYISNSHGAGIPPRRL